jgi:hypothetical protein
MRGTRYESTPSRDKLAQQTDRGSRELGRRVPWLEEAEKGARRWEPGAEKRAQGRARLEKTAHRELQLGSAEEAGGRDG